MSNLFLRSSRITRIPNRSNIDVKPHLAEQLGKCEGTFSQMKISSVIVKGISVESGTNFHFHLSFLSGEGQTSTSVRFNMVPSEPELENRPGVGLPGILELDYMPNSDELFEPPGPIFQASVVPGTTMDTLIDLLLGTHQMDRYE